MTRKEIKDALKQAGVNFAEWTDRLLRWDDKYEVEDGDRCYSLRQYWVVDGIIVRTREEWRKAMGACGVDEEDVQGLIDKWEDAIGDVCYPVSATVSWRAGSWGCAHAQTDPHDSIQGAGRYNMTEA